MRNINNILKLANFYSYAVSQAFDLLDSKRTIQSICDKVKDFVSKGGLSEESHRLLNYRVAKMAAYKFNKLVVPYANMPSVTISDMENRLLKGQNQDELNFFLHDLIHELLSPGSINKFLIKDEEIANSMNPEDDEEEDDEEEDDEEEDDEEDYEEDKPKFIYELSSPGYSLEEYIEEQVAESLTDKNKVTNNGLVKYISNLMIGVANSQFGCDFSDTEWDFDHPIDGEDVRSFFDEVNSEIETDISNLKNAKYKNLATKFYHSLKNWQANILTNVLPPGHEDIPEYKSKDIEQENKKRYDTDTNLNSIIRPIIGDTRQWIQSNFNINPPSISNKKPSLKEEKPISDLTNEYKMSLLRRWLLAVDRGTSIILGENLSRQLSFDF